jgi:hypothetical protein
MYSTARPRPGSSTFSAADLVAATSCSALTVRSHASVTACAKRPRAPSCHSARRGPARAGEQPRQPLDQRVRRLVGKFAGTRCAHAIPVGQQPQRRLDEQRSQGCRILTSPRGLASLAAYLREAGGAPGPSPLAPAGPAEELLARYRDYLLTERGLARCL